MNDSIQHRGPNGKGFFIQQVGEQTISLGQVRLSIIDLSNAGHQPMFYDKEHGAFSGQHNTDLLKELGDESIRIVFNGEIYNFQEIKEDLLKKGYTFNSHTDTEVILASYLERGEDCLSRFNGMWSFALYDPHKNELFCSRDRLGKKPFYYYFDENEFVFSSEIKGIIEHTRLNINVEENIDGEALDFYFTIGYIPAPWTIYKNIKKLEARHNLTIKMSGNKELVLENKCYYSIPKYKPKYDKNMLVQEGKQLLEKTVKDRMFSSDVPVGANLSGGLDSSSVVAEMIKRVNKENLHTFSIGFEGIYDESKYIHIVEKAFGTKHHHKYFKQEHFDQIVKDISFYYDEPFADYSSFPTTFVSNLAKNNVTVVLTGDGGDEIFGGYMMHQVGAQMNLIKKTPKFFRKILYYLLPHTSNNLSVISKLKEAMRVSFLPDEDFYANIGGSTLYKPEIYKKWTKEKFSEVLKAANGNFTQAMIDFDLFYNTMADNFLVKTDRASMSQPVEYRSPFCDVRWIEWSRRCPVKWKVNWRKTKILMRTIIKDIIPSQITNRGKKGFEPPLKERILDEKHIKKIKEGVNALSKAGLLTEQWKNFYEKEVLEKNNSVFNVYKIKLFLLIDRYEKWIKKTS